MNISMEKLETAPMPNTHACSTPSNRGSVASNHKRILANMVRKALFKARKCPSIRFNVPMRLDLAEETVKLRGVMDGYVRKLSKEIEKDLLRIHGEYMEFDLHINNRGICGFYYNDFCIVIEVPKDTKSFFIYTVVHVIDLNDDNKDLAYRMMRKALEMNYLGQKTNGATISLDETSDVLEYTLSYSQDIVCLDYNEFANIVMNFVTTIDSVHKTLMSAEDELLAEEQAEEDKRRTTQKEEEEEYWIVQEEDEEALAAGITYRYSRPRRLTL